jgi:hypothetical protein
MSKEDGGTAITLRDAIVIGVLPTLLSTTNGGYAWALKEAYKIADLALEVRK